MNGSKGRSGQVRLSKRRMVGIREEEEDVGSVEDVGMRKTPAQVEISQLFDQGEFRQSAAVDISGRRDNAQRTNPDDGLRPTDGRRRCCVPWIQTIYDETANHYNFSLISITNKVIISDLLQLLIIITPLATYSTSAIIFPTISLLYSAIGNI